MGSTFLGSMALLSPIFASKDTSIPSLSKIKRANVIDWTEVRKHFSLRNDLYHFNIASLGPPSQRVLSKLDETNQKLAEIARDGRWLFDEARASLAEFVAAAPGQLSFCRNTTEGMNIAINSIPLRSGDEVIITDQDHIGGAAPVIALQKSKGIKVKIAKLNPDGSNLFQAITSQVSRQTKVISVCHLCCTNGMILPIDEIVNYCRDKSIYSIVDGAQAVGMIPLELDRLAPDFYAASGHKWLYGPTGSGFLYTNKRLLDKLDPVFVGAYSDSEFNLEKKHIEYLNKASRDEYGTRNASQVAALAEAIKFIKVLGVDQIQSRSLHFRNELYSQLEHLDDVELLSPKANSHPGILSFRSNRLSSKDIVNQLRSDSQLSLRYIYEGNLDAVRVSIPLYTTDVEFSYLFDNLTRVLKA